MFKRLIFPLTLIFFHSLLISSAELLSPQLFLFPSLPVLCLQAFRQDLLCLSLVVRHQVVDAHMNNNSKLT